MARTGYDTQDHADSASDDGFHDHALTELYRAAEDLSPWYTASELAALIAARFRWLAEERAQVDPVVGPEPDTDVFGRTG